MGQQTDPRDRPEAADGADSAQAPDEPAAVDYFDQLAAIRQNIVEGVITCW